MPGMDRACVVPSFNTLTVTVGHLGRRKERCKRQCTGNAGATDRLRETTRRKRENEPLKPQRNGRPRLFQKLHGLVVRKVVKPVAIYLEDTISHKNAPVSSRAAALHGEHHGASGQRLVATRISIGKK